MGGRGEASYAMTPDLSDSSNHGMNKIGVWLPYYDSAVQTSMVCPPRRYCRSASACVEVDRVYGLHVNIVNSTLRVRVKHVAAAAKVENDCLLLRSMLVMCTSSGLKLYSVCLSACLAR